MGQMYEITCRLCDAKTGVSEGRGMRYGRDFADLYFNYMSDKDRIAIGMNTPSGSRNKIKSCSYSNQPLVCTSCNAISSKLAWSIEFESGWKFSPPNRCVECQAEMLKLSLPREGEINQKCWECDSEKLHVKLSAVWD